MERGADGWLFAAFTPWDMIANGMDVFAPVGLRGTVVGRYALHDKLAASAQAEVWLGRARGQPGSPLLAIKRLRRELLSDPIFVSAVVTEIRRAGALEHANLARVRDVALIEGCELLLVSDYLPGETLAMLFGACFRSGTRMPLPVAVGIVVGILRGLEAAHQARDPAGASLAVVHGGLSPHNVLVGVDGIPRVLDFGLAIARSRAPATTARFGQGKRAYMSPEQARRHPIDNRTDIYAAAVILWELLVGERLFRDSAGADVALQIINHRIPPLCELQPELPAQLDRVLGPALARAAATRPASAAALADALVAIVAPAGAGEIADWMRAVARDRLAERAELVVALAEAPDPPGALPAAGTTVPGEAGADPAPSPWAVSALPARGSTRAGQGGGGKTRRRLLLGGTVVAGLLLVGALRGARRVAAPGAASARPAPAPAMPPARAAAPISAPAPPGSPGIALERIAQRRAAESPVKVTRRSAPTLARQRIAPRRAGAKPRVALPACQPPYTVDAQGIRRIKRKCLP